MTTTGTTAADEAGRRDALAGLLDVEDAAAGTALRSATVREWSDQAGFASLRVLPVDHVFWRFYQLAG